ncbi:hypothetical protein [Neobacillus jeddahensis]|uniref:hypothetical protein n=1 Tax=Neobacillus jeddahensis TaxID=1461580 RepID=UPI000AB72FB1|nr:hypothetical protein [Neobacillus jeddahensis]
MDQGDGSPGFFRNFSDGLISQDNEGISFDVTTKMVLFITLEATKIWGLAPLVTGKKFL